MWRKIILLLIALCGITTVATADDSIQTASLSHPSLTRPPIERAPQRGTLYRVRYQGNTTYLFGTIHVGKPAFFPLEEEVTRALTHASTLMVELDIRNSEPFRNALEKHGLYAEADSIDKHLSQQDMTQLRRVLERHGMSYDAIAHMKPWLVANVLLGLDLNHTGYERINGIEYFLLSQAKAQAKAVQELETADYQLSLFDGMSDADQEQYLRENLAEIEDGKALTKTLELIDAWSTADGKAFDGMVREMQNDKSISSGFLQRVLLGQRNPAMATKIEVLLKQEQASFVGVGFLHLIGENGVPTLLQQRGYEVVKLY